MEKLMAYDLETLVMHVSIVALASVGMVEWLKNFVMFKRYKLFAVLGLMVLSVNVTLQMPFVNNEVTWGWNLLSLGTAFMQFGHAALVKLPDALIGRLAAAAKKDERSVE